MSVPANDPPGHRQWFEDQLDHQIGMTAIFTALWGTVIGVAIHTKGDYWQLLTGLAALNIIMTIVGTILTWRRFRRRYSK